MLGLEESPDFRAPGLNSLGRSCCRRSPNTAGFGTRSNVRRSMAPGIRYQSVAVEIDSNHEHVGSHPFGGSQSARID